jgi:phosphoribosylanthranilate isomerase
MSIKGSSRFIKYCGFTRLCDAIYASSLGIDALGFVFYEKSPRYIAPADAKKIIQTIRSMYINLANQNALMLEKPYAIGLFVNHSKAQVLEITQQSQIDILQFHGDESADFCEALAKITAKPYIKAMHFEGDLFTLQDYQQLCLTYPNAIAFLLDKQSQMYGGSGEKFNWVGIDQSIWQKNPAFLSGKPSVILAGGVFLKDIDLIKDLQINAIDLSTGLEIETQPNATHSKIKAQLMHKGIKSPKLMHDIAKAWLN